MKIIKRVFYLISLLFFFFTMASCGDASLSVSEQSESVPSESTELSSVTAEDDKIGNFSLHFINYDRYFEYLNDPSSEYYTEPADLEPGIEYVLITSCVFDAADYTIGEIKFIFHTFGLHFKEFLSATSSSVSVDNDGYRAEIMFNIVESESKTLYCELLLVVLQNFDLSASWEIGSDCNYFYNLTGPIRKAYDFGYVYSEDGSLVIFKYYGNDEEVIIPENVSFIKSYAFSNNDDLRKVIIPDSVTGIGEYAFYYSYGLTDIIYEGTKEQWDSILKDNSWNNNTGSYTIHCTDGDLEKE